MSTKRIDYAVEGMGCEGCVSTVARALLGVEGVLSATVDLASSSAHIEVDEQEPDFETLASAVQASGYRLVRS
jgi:Cu+-exporting ATPase